MVDAATSTRKGGGLSGLLQKILFVFGLVGLISLDQDIIRWSKLANWIIESYRALSEPLQIFLSRLLWFELPPFAADVLILGGVIFAAANVHSLRRSGNFVLWEGVKLFFLEQILQKSADHLLTDVHPRFAHVAAYLTVAIAYGLPALLILSGYRGEPFTHLSTGAAWAAYLYLVGGFALLSSLDNRVPHDRADRFQTRGFKAFVIASVVFLPSAIYRYMSFLVYCIILLVLVAWRLHLYLVGAFLAIVLLNEAYFRLVDDSPGKANCVLYSVLATCNDA